MGLQIKVPGGHVSVGSKVRRMTDKGIVTEHNWVAVCQYTGEVVEWATKDIAEFFLSQRFEHQEWLERRASYSA